MDWEEIIDSEPFSFVKACWFDARLREVQATGSKIMRSIPYLHYSRRPLAEVFPDQSYLHDAYKNALTTWMGEWKEYINQKYA
jgi:hypothetical protein